MTIETSTQPRVQGSTTGLMTAVMRAIAKPHGPRVLRLGVLREGRMVEERLMKDRTAVSVGRDSTCTVVAGCEPQSLFAVREDQYVLAVGAGMQARVALEGGVQNVHPGSEVVLDADARGKVVVGKTTILFQMVDAPIPAARAQLPLAVRNGQGIDWNLTMIAALSFLFHFGFVGAMYSDWVDPLVADAPTVAGLVDMAKLAPPNLLVETRPEPTLPANVAPKDKVADKVADTSRPSPRSQNAPSKADPGPASASPNAAKEAAMVANAERMAVDVLSTLKGASSTQRALSRGEIPPVDVEEAARKNTGVTQGNEIATHSTGPLATGRPGALADIGNTKTSRTGDTPGKMRETQGPSIDTRIDPARPTTPVPDVDRVIAGLRPAFRRCYEIGLSHDPSQAGRAVLTAKVSPNGEVASADVASISGLSSGVGTCLARALRGAQFTAPGGTGSTLSVPVTFVTNAK